MESNQNYSAKELLRRIAAGDEQAFTSLFWRYKDMIYTTGLRITGSVTEAEEIVQDVFVKLWTKRNDLPDIENLEGYIFMMARNYTYNSLQRLVKASAAGAAFPSERDSNEVSADAIRTLFYSPIAWVILVAFYVVTGIYFVTPLMDMARVQQVQIENSPAWTGFQGPLTLGLFRVLFQTCCLICICSFHY